MIIWFFVLCAAAVAAAIYLVKKYDKNGEKAQAKHADFDPNSDIDSKKK